MKSLVIGSGLLGSAIASEVVRHKGKKSLITTTRDHNKNKKNCIYLDLFDVNSWIVPDDVKVAYFCAGVSKIDECSDFHNKSRLINVVNTLTVINKLVEKKVFLVFLSSNGVFDGIKPFCRISDSTNPLSYYAKLKAEVEEKMSMFKSPYSIVRLTKVLDSRLDLMTSWVSDLKERKKIVAFNDVTISPISSNYAGKYIFNIGNGYNHGIFHLSGQGNYTYYDIALMIAKRLGVSSAYVRGMQCNYNLPRYASLDMSENTCDFPCYPQKIECMIDEIF
jgi:dTDP-4-dehydrorhamnose reductase